MDLSLVYEAIQNGNLFELTKKETFDNREVIHFKRHLSTFRMIKKFISAEETEFVILKDNQKARFGTVREIWSDYKELSAAN